MQLENINILRNHFRLAISLFSRSIRSTQEERLTAAVDGDRIGCGCGPRYDYFLCIPVHFFGGDHQCSRSTIPGGGGIQQVDGSGYHAGFFEPFHRYFLVQAGKGIVHCVGMGVDRERGKIGVLPAVFVHVAAHDQCIQPHE